jgi:protoporphyrinogen/coproporphyrinogen III oxidase
MVKPPVVVLGAGITGLAAGYRLHQLGKPVLVLEGSHRAGGTIQHVAVQRPEGTWNLELGPNTVRLSPELRQLAHELGLAAELVAPAGAHRRWVVRGGKLRTVPAGPLGVLTTNLLPFRAKWFALREGSRALPDLGQTWSLHALMAQRFGLPVADALVDPFVAGVWAGDAHELSAEHAFPQVWQALREHGSVLKGFKALARARRANGEAKPSIVSFKAGGLQRFTNALALALGPSLRLNTPAQHVEQTEAGHWRVHVTSGEAIEARQLISTLSTEATLQVFSRTPLQALLQPLATQPHPPVSMLHLGFQRSQIQHPLNGFGFLVPSSERQLRLLGCVFPSSMFEGRAPNGHVLLVVFLGGTRHPTDAHLPEHQQLELALRDLKPLLGITGSPVFSQSTTWPKAIPQYDLAHAHRVAALTAAERLHPQLQLCGNYWGGIGVPDRLRAGLQSAEREAK